MGSLTIRDLIDNWVIEVVEDGDRMHVHVTVDSALDRAGVYALVNGLNFASQRLPLPPVGPYTGPDRF